MQSISSLIKKKNLEICDKAARNNLLFDNSLVVTTSVKLRQYLRLKNAAATACLYLVSGPLVCCKGWRVAAAVRGGTGNARSLVSCTTQTCHFTSSTHTPFFTRSVLPSFLQPPFLSSRPAAPLSLVPSPRINLFLYPEFVSLMQGWMCNKRTFLFIHFTPLLDNLLNQESMV